MAEPGSRERSNGGEVHVLDELVEGLSSKQADVSDVQMSPGLY